MLSSCIVLERVALGQSRFSVPGIAVDARGIALGRFGALLFPGLDGVIAWLRLYAGEDSLDDLFAGMKALRLRTQLGSRALLLLVPAASSHVLDRAARCARLAGGVTFTGTAKHFVKYRDERSPYGYDVVDLGPAPAGATVLLHAEEATQGYAQDGELDPSQLVLRLSLKRVPGGERLDDKQRQELYLAAPHGLAGGVIRYLLRARVEAEVALVSPRDGSAFREARAARGYLLARVHALPARLLANLRGVPGLGVFHPEAPNVAVEVGWAHPVALSSCASLFPQGSFHLFWGDEDRVDAIPGPVPFARAELVASLDAPAAAGTGGLRAVPMQASAAPSIATPVRLVPSMSQPRRVAGTLVPLEEVGRLKRLVYALPPSMLAGHRVALTSRGVLLLGDGKITPVPLGTVLVEAAPGLLVPLGMEIAPRVAAGVLVDSLDAPGGASGERVVVFPHEGGPFVVAAGELAPLERRVLARVPVAAPDIVDAKLPVAGDEPRVTNDPVGRFALWGWKPQGRGEPGAG